MNKQWIIFGVIMMIIVMMVTGQAPDPIHPNIVFIWFDDLSFADIGYYGASYPTPTIDSFALKSIRIHNHYTDPICGPSRNAFLTGRYSWRVGVTGNGGSIDYGVSYDSENELFTQHLKRESGNIYKTFIGGKSHIGYKYAADLPENRGFDEQLIGITSPGTGYHSKQNCQQMSRFDNTFPVNDDIKTQRDTLFPDGKLCYHDFRDSTGNIFIGDETYRDELSTQAAIQFIDNYANTNNLFIYLSLRTPHGALVEPPTNRDDVDYTICDIPDLDENKRLFCRSMQFGQALINDVVNSLKNNNIYDNSIIIISSDNGGTPGLSQNGDIYYGKTLPFRGRKGVVFEGGIRTPNFMMGGYIEQRLNEWTNNVMENCNYNGLVHVSDWYHIFLDIIGLNDDNKDSDHIDMSIWKDIERECKTSENLHTDGRKEIIGMRFCNDDINEYLTPAFIRYNEWKLVINGTSNRPCNVAQDFIKTGVYVTESGDTSPIPNDEIYQETQNNAEIAHFYKSECYDNIPSTERNENNILFKFDEFMLFNMETDKIEACNVANQHPDIVNNLTQKIISRINDYNGGGSPYTTKSGGAVLSRVNTFDCEYSITFPISWDGVNDDLTDGNIIWQALIDKKNECILGSSLPPTPTDIGIIFVSDITKTWNEAEAHCQNTYGSNSHLISITNTQDRDEISSYLDSTINFAWIGLKDINNDDTYLWIDGTQCTENNGLCTTYWADGQPNSDKRCVGINNNLQFETKPCNKNSKPFFCSIPSNNQESEPYIKPYVEPQHYIYYLNVNNVTYLYIGGGIIVLLIINIICYVVWVCNMQYFNKGKYGKVQECSTEDDDEENDAFIQ